VLEARYDLVQFRRLLESGDTAEREAVVWALGLMDELDSIPMLVAALKDEEEIVRLSAARSLGMVEIPSSLSRKASPFEDRHEEQMVKDSLVKMLRDPSLEVRRVVVDTLVKQKAPATARYLIDRLKSEDGEMRAVLVQGLGILRDATSIPALLAATDDLDTRVRLAAVEALGHFLQAGGLPPALTERMILVLQSMSMVDVDLAVCQSAGQLVKKYSQNGALELE
jgi:HEAT repeat protein